MTQAALNTEGEKTRAEGNRSGYAAGARPGAHAFMVTAERRKAIILLALPIIGGMVSQNILNLVDTAMVGSLGTTAIAAVGIGGFANFVSISFITGLAAAVQAMSARRVGEGRAEIAARPLNGGLLLALALGVPLGLCLYVITPWAAQFLSDDPELVAIAGPYIQIRVLSALAVGVNFSFRGYWNAIKLSRMYMQTLVSMHAINIGLNWVLIYGHLGAPAMGASGAALASTLALYCGSLQYLYLGFRHARTSGFLQGIPDRSTITTMLRLLVPNGIQTLMFALGFLMLYWIIGQVGTEELAAANVLINLSLVAILPGLGFGMAAATLVGQALGRSEPTDAQRWGWEVMRLAMLVVGGIALIGLVAPQPLLAIFLRDPAAVELATTPLRLTCACLALDSAGAVLMQAHMGAGDMRRTALVSVGIQWGLALPLIYLIAIPLGMGLMDIWLVQNGSRVLQAAVLMVLWRRGAWMKSKA